MTVGPNIEVYTLTFSKHLLDGSGSLLDLITPRDYVFLSDWWNCASRSTGVAVGVSTGSPPSPVRSHSSEIYFGVDFFSSVLFLPFLFFGSPLSLTHPSSVKFLILIRVSLIRRYNLHILIIVIP